MSWWKTFFDADYPVLYASTISPERTEREVAFLAGLLKLREGARVLDLCCGTGRHSIALQRRGYRVCGVDYSSVLLALARDRSERVGAYPALARADAGTLPLRAGSFDAAICLFNSLGYAGDSESLQWLREVRRCAAQLVLEVVHRDELVRNSLPGGNFEWTEREGVRVLAERWIEPVPGISRALFRIQREGQPDVVKDLRHRIYTATELVALVRRAGFEQVQCFGDYDRRPFAIDSPLLIVHAR